MIIESPFPENVVTASDRAALTRKFDADQCHAALALPDIQQTVQDVAEARLRVLSRKISPEQVRRHWRDWNAVAKANGWSKKGLEADPRAGRDRSDGNAPDCRWHRKVWGNASGLAHLEDRGVTAEDLRHACYFVATERSGRNGRKLSIYELDNDAFSRVLNLFACLADPDNLNAMSEWLGYVEYDNAAAKGVKWIDRPEKPGERRNHEFAIRRAQPGYLAHILKERFDTASWQSLSIRNLRLLIVTLASRRNSGKSKQPYQRKTRA